MRLVAVANMTENAASLPLNSVSLGGDQDADVTTVAQDGASRERRPHRVLRYRVAKSAALYCSYLGLVSQQCPLWALRLI